ncbi:hypothetical protein PR003_g24699 [Phytophthora rubi]|uniref:RxLR effector protein n=1 Tax=Phytophthora rubi TaxID=129364 RepID=A0A6A4CQX9_9STRA|nr:hypothetical protein PR002_g23888 [Phytophthora rubi]KAE8981650.1 hypothetical protein PR001_g23939 [Phytophthora rubi]KAE9292688.1 hypothetical protein PR003_g24699 [Phytophthora rubi]
MRIASANDPEVRCCFGFLRLLLLVLQNSAGPSVEPPDTSVPSKTSSTTTPVSIPVQASSVPAPAPTTTRASEAMQPAHGSASSASAPHVHVV